MRTIIRVALRKGTNVEPPLEERWKYTDPNEAERGILLSNQIHQLCEQHLLIAEHYDSKNLRPASYTLRIGESFIDSEGNAQRLADNGEILFKKNSIIFVTTKEKLAIPYYVVARFNIRVNWVYDGILLGTGPQVDPGFSGFLSCPLYNLTNVDIVIRKDQDFATIDFEKTTNLLGNLPWDEKKKIIERARDKQLEFVEGQTYSFYKTPPLKPLQHKKSHRMVSTLLELREELRKWRALGVGSLVAFFGLTLSLLGFGANLYRQNSDLAKQFQDGKNELRLASDRIAALEVLNDHRASLDQASQPVATMAPPKGPTKNDH